jgi:uncharacterized protein (TIGR03437 family)
LRTARVYVLGVWLVFAPLAHSQLAPVIGSRGVVNAYSQEPAPTAAAPGSLIWITGFNFGETDGAKVLVNGAEAAVISVSSTRIVAQVPLDAAPGAAEVIVARGDSRSRPARLTISAVAPAVRSAADTGYGEAAATISGDTATLTAGGFGKDLSSAGDIAVHVGGMPAAATVAARDGNPGEYEVSVSLPSGWKPGDVISLRAGARAANRTTIQSASSPEVSFVKLPSGASDLTSLTTADLRGSYVIGSSARDDQGCIPSYLFDLAKASADKLDGCLVSGSLGAGQGGAQGGGMGGGTGTAPGGAQGASLAAAVSVFTAESEGSGLAAFVGPAESTSSVSSKVLVLHPERSAPLTVQLPSAASALSSMGAGGITAILAGDAPKIVTIDTRTGDVKESQGGMPGLAAGAGLAGVAGFGQNVDLGDGLNQVLSSFATLADGTIGVVVGDSATQPTKMKFAILSGQSEISARSFPDGWLALVAPAAATTASGGGLPGGGVSSRRVSVVAHPSAAEFYVLAANSAGSAHALVVFPKAGTAARVVAFPSGWYAAACTTQAPLHSFQLSSLIAVPGSQTLETAVKSPCLATGMLVADSSAEQATVVTFPAQAPLNLSGTTGSLNEFVYGGNAATPDTLVVFDGAANSPSPISLPSEVSTFSGLTQITSMNSLLGAATKSSQGDAGFVLFNLETGESRVFALPSGFSSAASVGVFPVTRKLVALGTRTDGTGSQLVVYDLTTGEPTVIDNPSGVAWVGSAVARSATLPGAGGFPGGGTPGGGTMPGGGTLPGGGTIPGGGAGFQGAATAGLTQANTKANTVAAVCFDSDKKQVGVLGLRVH